MGTPKPWEPDAFTRLQIGFGLIAIMAAGLWFTRDAAEGTQTKVFRVAVTFVGVGGLIVSTLLGLAKKG